MSASSTLIRTESPVGIGTARGRGWLDKAAAVLMIGMGLAFIVVTLAANLYKVGPAFDRLTNSFRPVIAQQSVQTDREDLAGLAAAGTEIQTKLLPGLAQQLNMTPTQLNQMLGQQYPKVAAGLQTIPTVTPTFNNLLTSLDQQRPLFRSADAIPTTNLPATTVPWSMLAVGIVLVGLGTFVWFSPRAGAAVLALVLGAFLVVMPLALNMTHKAADADQMNADLKPIYTQQLITQASGALATLGAMGTQMQTEMLPGLAAQLHMTGPQLQLFLGQNYPATAAALSNMPAAMTHFDNLVTAFKQRLGDYNTLKPVSFEPIVWFMISGGIALALLGAGGLVVPAYRRRHS